MFESICQFENHEEKPILGVCTNLTCKKFRPYCHQCLIEFHCDHITEVRDLHQISNWSQSCAPLQEQLIQTINQYNSIVTKLTNLKNSLQFDCSIDLSSLRLSDLDNHINCLVNLSSIQELIQDLFNKSQDQLEVVSILCKETISLKQYKENIYYQQEQQSDEIQIKNDIQIQSIENQSNTQLETHQSMNDSTLKTPEKQNRNQTPKIRNSEQYTKVSSKNICHTPQTRSQSYKNQIQIVQQRNSISNLKKQTQQSKPKNLQVQTVSKEYNYCQQQQQQQQQQQSIVKKSENDKQQSIQESESTTPNNQRQINIQLQQEPSIPIVQYQGFRFSENLKSSTIKLQKDCKIAKGFNGYVLCEPFVPQSGESTFEINIDRCDLVYLGICSKYIVQAFNFDPSLSAFDTHGSFLLSNKGVSYSCLEQKLNYVQQKFNFSSGDTITINVNQMLSYITWKTNFKKQTFSMKFDNTKEMYVCVRFQRMGFSNDSQVEIKNYELNN